MENIQVQRFSKAARSQLQFFGWPKIVMYGPEIYKKNTIILGNFKSYSWVGLLGQPSRLAGGWVGLGGRDNCYIGLGQPILGRPHQKMFFCDKFSVWATLPVSGPYRPQ